GAAREAELATNNNFFKSAIDNQATLLRYDNTRGAAKVILRQLVNNIPLPLRMQDELVTQGKEILETAAGQEL
ncbi:hypothetical protein PILCRDRAFT_54393, partial [Piloderma croceum F 1598]